MKGEHVGSHAQGVPDDVSVVIPRLFCRDPQAELAFCASTFGAAELNRRPGPDGKTAHVLIAIGPAMVMLESEWPQIANRAPAADASSPVVLYVYVADVDETVRRAQAAGATTLVEPANQFWGDRTAWIMDPSNHVWTVATRIEDTTEDERKARLAKMHSDAQS